MVNRTPHIRFPLNPSRAYSPPRQLSGNPFHHWTLPAHACSWSKLSRHQFCLCAVGEMSVPNYIIQKKFHFPSSYLTITSLNFHRAPSLPIQSHAISSFPFPPLCLASLPSLHFRLPLPSLTSKLFLFIFMRDN